MLGVWKRIPNFANNNRPDASGRGLRRMPFMDTTLSDCRFSMGLTGFDSRRDGM